MTFSIVSCSQSKNPDQQTKYTTDYVGKKLNSEQIDSMFQDEELQYQNAQNTLGSVIILKNPPKYTAFDNSEISLENLLGTYNGSLKNIYRKFSLSELKQYYSSLSDKDKSKFISATPSCLDAVKTESDFKNQIYNEYELILSQQEGYKNSHAINLNNLKLNINHTEIKSSLIAFFDNLKKEDLHFRNNAYLVKLHSLDEKLALNIYKKLKVIQSSIEKTSSILQANVPLTFSFLTSKSTAVRDEFVEFCTLNELEELSIIWDSRKLTSEEKNNIISSLKSSQNSENRKLGLHFEIENEGIKYLKDNDINKASINISQIYYLLKGKVNTNKTDLQFLKNYLEINKDTLMKNNYTDGAISLNTVNTHLANHLNKTSYSLEDYYNLFEKAGLHKKINLDSLIINNPISFHNYINLKPFTISKELFDINANYVYVDAETGEFPNSYDRFLDKFIPEMNSNFGTNIQYWQEVNYLDSSNSSIKSYNIYVSHGDIHYKVEIPDTGDWYSPTLIIETLNKILENIGVDDRWNRIGEEQYIYVLLKPESFNIIDQSLKFSTL